MKRLLKNLGIWILIAMAIGIVVGIIMGPEAAMFKPLGDLFIQLIKMLVVPLVLISIISGAAALGETRSAGVVGGISISYMLITTFFAIVLALFLAEMFQPGSNVDRSQVSALITDYDEKDETQVETEEQIEFIADTSTEVESAAGIETTIETSNTEGVNAVDTNTANEETAMANEQTIKEQSIDKEPIAEEAIAEVSEVIPNEPKPKPMGFWETILSMIPDNPMRALAEGNILQIIIFGLFFGFGLSSLPQPKREPITNALNTLLEALIWCINKVMYVAPFGVFGLIADATGTFGFDILMQVANVLWIDILAVLIIGLGLYPITVALFSRVPLKRYFRAMIKPQVVSFSSASSLATLPVNMEACDEMGISKQTSGFVLPLGATINMSGNAIYYGLIAIFFAQFYGIELGMAEYVSIAVVCTLGAIGQAGIPGPTLLAAAVLVAAGIPLEGLPLFYALDRIFDMIRTTLNITGDAACAAVVDRFVKRD